MRWTERYSFMNKYNWFILLGSFILFYGCSGGNTAESLDPDENKFFGVEDYFQSEIERLNQEQPAVTKTLNLNGKEDVLQPDSVDFAAELEVFSNSGINKVSWLDRYTADTTRTADGALQQTRYEAQDDKLRTRLVEVTYTDDDPSRIHIRNRTENLVLNATQQLTYRPGEEVIIEQQQRIRFLKPNTLRIHIQLNR